MALLGIESILYGVEDLETSHRFFVDWGLKLETADSRHSLFKLEQGSSVVLRRNDDPSLPSPFSPEKSGFREIIWGVDTPKALEDLVAKVGTDRKVTRDEDGTAHFIGPDGLPMGLRIYNRKQVRYAPDPVNAPDMIRRMNQTRKWRRRALPKAIMHLGVIVMDYVGMLEFLRERLGMVYVDHSRGFAVMARCDGVHEHHSIFAINASSMKRDYPGTHHISFGVEDIDEIMVGVNYMTRRGWGDVSQSGAGLGRHRMSSALFWYQDCPAGGEVEYLTDTDFLDDNWVPRAWDPTFGYTIWAHNLLPFQMDDPVWEFTFDPDGASLEEYRKSSKSALHAEMTD